MEISNRRLIHNFLLFRQLHVKFTSPWNFNSFLFNSTSYFKIQHEFAFRLITMKSTARLKCAREEHLGRERLVRSYKFCYSCDVMILSRGWRAEVNVCNTFQGRPNDSLMIIVLIYELVIIL